MSEEHIIYSIVIPTYNSETMIGELCERLTPVMESLGFGFEIILVDDCSHDGTWSVIESIHERDSRVKVVQLVKNVGQQRAIMCAFSQVSGDYVITMDDDLQHPPEEIPKLIAAMEAEPSLDAVIGCPREKRQSFIRNVISDLYNIINSHIFQKSRDLRMAPYRLIKRQIVDELIRLRTFNPIIGLLLLTITVNIKNVVVEYRERGFGRSTYTPARIIKATLDSILQNSTLPLKIVSVFGTGVSMISILYAVYNIFRKIFLGVSVPGWTSLMVVNLFLFGVILFSLGIIGEYLIRIIQSTQETPLYIIRQKKF